MNKTLVAAVFAALIAGIAAAPDLHASSSSPSKKLLQWQWNRNTNLAANTARASIATSDAINRAVDNGASLRATRGAGVVGSNMAWAASQDQDVFNTVERFFDAGRKLRTMAEGRQLLQYGWNRNVNLAANTARASIATSDAINRAVDNGASLRSTRGAGIVGSNMAWAAAQGNQDVFNTVQRFYDAGRKLRMMPEGRQA